MPEQPDGAAAIDVLAGSMSPPLLPHGPHELRGSWSFSTLGAGEREREGFTVLAREVPHKGGRTFGYRVSDAAARSPTYPTTAPRSAAGSRRVRRVPRRRDGAVRGRRSPGPRRAAPDRRGARRREQLRARAAPTTRWRSRAAPARAACCCSTTAPTGPTRRSTRWRPALRERRREPRRAGHRLSSCSRAARRRARFAQSWGHVEPARDQQGARAPRLPLPVARPVRERDRRQHRARRARAVRDRHDRQRHRPRARARRPEPAARRVPAVRRGVGRPAAAPPRDDRDRPRALRRCTACSPR